MIMTKSGWSSVVGEGILAADKKELEDVLVPTRVVLETAMFVPVYSRRIAPFTGGAVSMVLVTRPVSGTVIT